MVKLGRRKMGRTNVGWRHKRELSILLSMYRRITAANPIRMSTEGRGGGRVKIRHWILLPRYFSRITSSRTHTVYIYIHTPTVQQRRTEKQKRGEWGQGQKREEACRQKRNSCERININCMQNWGGYGYCCFLLHSGGILFISFPMNYYYIPAISSRDRHLPIHPLASSLFHTLLFSFFILLVCWHILINSLKRLYFSCFAGTSVGLHW